MANLAATALPDPAAARRVLIPILGLVARGTQTHYNAETEAQAREAFQIAQAITQAARAPFRVLPNALEIRASKTAGRMSFGWKEPDEIGELIDAE